MKIFPFLHFLAKLGMIKDLGKWTECDSLPKNKFVKSMRLKHLID